MSNNTNLNDMEFILRLDEMYIKNPEGFGKVLRNIYGHELKTIMDSLDAVIFNFQNKNCGFYKDGGVTDLNDLRKEFNNVIRLSRWFRKGPIIGVNADAFAKDLAKCQNTISMIEEEELPIEKEGFESGIEASVKKKIDCLKDIKRQLDSLDQRI